MDEQRRLGRATRPSLDGVSHASAQRVANGYRGVRRSPLRSSGGSTPTHVRTADSSAVPHAESSTGKASARRLFLDMSLPGGDSKLRHQFKKVGRRRSMRTLALRAAASVVIFTVVIGGLLFAKGYMKVHKVFQGGQTAAALSANVDPNMLKGEGDGRINILLLGKGGPGHDGPDLTDTMLIFSVDPVNKTAALLSIPRDLWVQVPGYWSMKINAAYANAKYKAQAQGKSDKASDTVGIPVAEKMVEQVVGIPIHYYAMVDFTAFQQAVNTVGGVHLYVPETLYDPTMAWQNHWSPILAQKGWQNFDGYHALLYVRSRETSSDFARTERQRQLIVALEQKVFTLDTFANPVKLSSLMDAFGNHAQMDMSISDAMRFSKILKGIDTKKIQSIGLTTAPHNFVTTGAVGNQSIVRPLAGFNNYTAIQNYVRSTLRDGYIVRENARVTVLNGTNVQGLASKEADVLKTYGYNVTSVGYAPTKDYQKTAIIDLSNGSKKYTAHYLENRFSTKATSALPQGVQANGADFVIIVGTNETTRSKN